MNSGAGSKARYYLLTQCRYVQLLMKMEEVLRLVNVVPNDIVKPNTRHILQAEAREIQRCVRDNGCRWRNGKCERPNCGLPDF